MLLIGGPLDGQYHPRPLDGRQTVMIIEREPLPMAPALGSCNALAVVDIKQHIYRVEKLTVYGDDMSFYCHDKLTAKQAFQRLFDNYRGAKS